MDTARRNDARPQGLDRRFYVLAMMEFWERFATAGVKSLLIVILADHVLAGDLSEVLGAHAIQRLFETWFGGMGRAGMASQVYGYANALLYAAVLLGGLAGDLLLGRRAAVLWSGCVACAGLALMTTPLAFLPGLALFATGTGTLKANLSAQLSQLFTTEAERQRGYTLYLGTLNAGVICGPLVCGTLAVTIGWSWAIAAAGLALALALAVYAASAPLPGCTAATPSRCAERAPAPGLREHGLLISAILSIYCCYAAYDQIGDAFLLWARMRIDLHVAGWPVPVSWFLSLDGLFTLLFVAGWQALAPRLARQGFALDPVSQILLGSLFCAAGYLILAAVSAGDPARVPLAAAIAYLLCIDIAVVLIWPSGLSLIAATAPPRLAGFWMGLFYLHGFFAGLWVGISGSYFGGMPDERFWLLHALVAGLGVILALVANLVQRGDRAPQAITTSA